MVQKRKKITVAVLIFSLVGCVVGFLLPASPLAMGIEFGSAMLVYMSALLLGIYPKSSQIKKDAPRP